MAENEVDTQNDGAQVDEAQITDDQAVFVNGEQVDGDPIELPYDDEGNLKEGFKGPDPDEWGDEEAAQERQRAAFLTMEHEVLAEIAGQRGLEDPDEMSKEELVDEILAGTFGEDGLPIGYVSEDGQVKGPGPQWEKDEEGDFVNR